jgi:2-oxo-4-hydroxy-4-carboxy-5-ureidoimidazoline decarboxylase
MMPQRVTARGRRRHRGAARSGRVRCRRMALSARHVTLSIGEVDAMDSEMFVAALGSAVEHSPWVALEAWRRRPFESVVALQLAFEAAIRGAPRERRLELLRAHPELAGREAAAGELTGASAREQRAARLDRLGADELAALTTLNADYRARFGFPFIACVREHSVESLLAWGRARLAREPDAEAATALAEVGKIVGLRLRELVADR